MTAQRINTDIGMGTLTRLKRTDIDDGIDGGSVTRFKLVIDGGTRRFAKADIVDSVRDYFQMGCSHEHDCCGCFFGGAGRVTVRRGAIFFTTRYSRNV